jgi:RNA polymerase sigma factor (sigma-70 family)
MTDNHALLAEYARTGSDAAFYELVTRYVGLVYSTALRLVGGDAHLAEDVAQTVFLDLARRASSLSSEVMLGGWLHQRTFNVAAPMMRAARRRQSREKEAVQMSALQDPSADNLERVAPMLDEAITKLDNADRTAILLRFFERRDFRAIGQALGSNEDAARMRVNRALAKLHIILTHRGVTLSAAALGTALSAETLTATPAGLVTIVAGHVLASSAAGGPAFATLLKIMAMTKLKTGVITAVILAGAATSLVIQTQARARLRGQDEALRQQSDQLGQLVAANERLSNLLAQANGATDQLAVLPNLRAEAGALRKQTNDLAMVREENRRLQQGLEAKPKTPLQINEERIAKVGTGKNWLLAFRTYAMDHQDQYPTNFEQATSFLTPNSNGQTNSATDKFEIVYHGSDIQTNPGDTIVLREKEAWQNSDGKWVKIYGMYDGSVQTVTMPLQWNTGSRMIQYNSFEEYEKDHLVAPSGQ